MAFAARYVLVLSFVLELPDPGVELRDLCLLLLDDQQQLIERTIRDFLHLRHAIFDYAALSHLNGVDVLLYLARYHLRAKCFCTHFEAESGMCVFTVCSEFPISDVQKLYFYVLRRYRTIYANRYMRDSFT